MWAISKGCDLLKNKIYLCMGICKQFIKEINLLYAVSNEIQNA